MQIVWVHGILVLTMLVAPASSWHVLARSSTAGPSKPLTRFQSQASGTDIPTKPDIAQPSENDALFQSFVRFLEDKQEEIIKTLEDVDGSGAVFTRDAWGVYIESKGSKASSSGGITRVIQGGNVIEKGACSLTLIQNGVLSAERASTIRARQDISVKAGDKYAAAALSIVLHTRSPLVPTFRSDVRIFVVADGEGNSNAWFGGGADLTPYYLDDEDIASFHRLYRDLANKHDVLGQEYSYKSMKKACDEYFYLPARSEHRGSGGIFFDDLQASAESLAFVQGVADGWMPSWLPIVEKHRGKEYTEKQRQWQLLRRGRYLEFNLLYDRGVKFGLANANPRVEGVMVSAPPLIAFEYNHAVEEGSPEAALVKILKEPRQWV